MRLIKFAILLLIMSGCNNPKEKTNNLEQKLKPVAIKTNGIDDVKNISKETMPDFDRIKYATDIKVTEPPLQPVYYQPPAISCFDPNLSIDNAIELISSGIEDTQWFIVDKKNVSNEHNKLDQKDTILMKEKLLTMDWKLIDSSQTNTGNQNKIILKMQKENRICTVEKQLYQGEKGNENVVQEWFEVRTVKIEN